MTRAFTSALVLSLASLGFGCSKAPASTEQAAPAPAAAGGEKAPSAPETVAMRCASQVDEDGDTIVSSEADDYVVVLGGHEWEIHCDQGQPVALMAQFSGFSVSFASVQGAPDAQGTTLEEFVAGVQTGIQNEGKYTPVTPSDEKLGDDQRRALCFEGPFEASGRALHVMGCVTQRRNAAAQDVYSAVTWIGPTEVVTAQGAQAREAVRALATSWLLLSEIPDSPEG